MAKLEAERIEAEQRKAEEEERARKAAEAKRRQEVMEEEDRRRAEAQERAERAERERLWAAEMFRRTVAAGRLQYALRRVLARHELRRQVQRRVDAARDLERFVRRNAAIEWHDKCEVSIRVLQGLVRKVVSVTISSTVAMFWQEVQPAREDVIQMHRRLSEQVAAESGSGSQYLSSSLQQFSTTSRLNPGNVIQLLKAIDEERALRSAAELEIATLAAASNVMFRLYVRRKVRAIRQRTAEKKRQIIEAARQRERLLAERRAVEGQSSAVIHCLFIFGYPLVLGGSMLDNGDLNVEIVQHGACKNGWQQKILLYGRRPGLKLACHFLLRHLLLLCSSTSPLSSPPSFCPLLPHRLLSPLFRSAPLLLSPAPAPLSSPFSSTSPLLLHHLLSPLTHLPLS